jgi:hypothetical protein
LLVPPAVAAVWHLWSTLPQRNADFGLE